MSFLPFRKFLNKTKAALSFCLPALQISAMKVTKWNGQVSLNFSKEQPDLVGSTWPNQTALGLTVILKSQRSTTGPLEVQETEKKSGCKDWKQCYKFNKMVEKRFWYHLT